MGYLGFSRGANNARPVVYLEVRDGLHNGRVTPNPPPDVVQQAQATLRTLDAGPSAPDSDQERARAHRTLWLAHKARGEFEAALTHCEAWIALAGPAAGDEAPVPPDAVAAVPPALVTLLTQARQRRKPLALAALEINAAAALRERHGDGVADAVEREVAQLLRLRLRSRDMALPWTQRRWLVALTDTPPAAAAAICDRLRAAVQHHDWAFVAPGLQVTIALGLVTDVADASPDSALQRADAALKRAR
jgi:diguanylate cyclase (GGDEF)-like protein